MTIFTRAIRWSFSAANPDSRCDLKRVLRDIVVSDGVVQKKVKLVPLDDGALPRRVGSAIHLFLERYEEHCYNVGSSYDEGAAEEIAGVIIGESELDEKEEADYLDMVRKLTRYKRFDLNVKSAAEEPLSFKIEGKKITPCEWSDEKAIIRAKIDRYYDPGTEESFFVFVDYKSNRAMFDIDKDLNKAKQLKFYPILYFLKHPEKRPKDGKAILSFDFIRHGKSSSTLYNFKEEENLLIGEIRGYILRMVLKAKNAKENISKIELTKEGILNYVSDHFEPMKNDFCGGCEFMTRCPHYAKVSEAANVDLSLSTEELKNIKEGNDRQSRAIMSHLRALYINKGIVKIGSKSLFGKIRKTSDGYDTKKLMELMESEILLSVSNNTTGEEKEILSSVIRSRLKLLKMIDIGSSALERARRSSPDLALYLEKSKKEKKIDGWTFLPKKEKGKVEWA